MVMESKGRVAKATHVGIPADLTEEEHGRAAFAGPVSHLYRTIPATAWIDVDGPLRPAAFDLNLLSPPDADDPEGLSTAVLYNDDLRVRISRRTASMPYALRNADGDEIAFVHHGAGVLQTDYGPLPYEAGDYLVIPKGTVHRWVPDGSESFLLVIESTAAVTLPDFGLMGRHAVVDPKVLATPEPWTEPPADWTGDGNGRWWRVRVKRLQAWTTFTYPHNPFTAVGWAGDLAPYRLHVRDIRPVISPRYHLPPSVHTTFRCGRFDIATFVPRPFETDPESLRVPFFHANVDNDEVIFYSRGDFFSRKGIGEGWLTLHPQGAPHGPQPGAAERAAAKETADEIAVMIECQAPLSITDEAKAAEDPAYTTSWARGMGLVDG
ncbi:MAG TPA: homogentisate 1,2-dioxygenase [Mycobacteriales bacterium]|nr:homogentisate 1,2-dioxygenase [Mycobacteriales bacterium]